MKVLSRGSVSGSIVALALLGACSDKKSFAGATPSAASEEKQSEANPEVEPAPEPEPAKAEVETTNVFKDCDASASSHFVGDLYELPAQTQRLPDFTTIKSIKQICLKQIDITVRDFSEGFPGVDNLKEWFALNINVNLKVEKAGEYTFAVNSDDGSMLYIDGAVVVSNDMTHSPKEAKGKVQLTAGTHKVNLQYFQGPANQIALELFWTPPGGTKSYIPTELISRPN